MTIYLALRWFRQDFTKPLKDKLQCKIPRKIQIWNYSQALRQKGGHISVFIKSKKWNSFEYLFSCIPTDW